VEMLDKCKFNGDKLLDLRRPSLLVLLQNKSTSLTLNKPALFINAKVAFDLKLNVFERIKLSKRILGSFIFRCIELLQNPFIIKSIFLKINVSLFFKNLFKL